MSITFMDGPMDRSGTLLYDADCAICVVTASWLAKRVAASRLRLMELGRSATDPRIAALVEGRPLTATIHFMRSDDTVLTGARALLAAFRSVPRWRLLSIAFDHPAGHLVLEPIYRQIAAHRRGIGRLLRLPAACALPLTQDATE